MHSVEELANQVGGLTGAIDQLEARFADIERRSESVRAWTLDLSASIVSVADLAAEALLVIDAPGADVQKLVRPILVGLVAVGALATRTAVAVSNAPPP